MVLRPLHEDGISRPQLARALSIYPVELDQLMFGLLSADTHGRFHETLP